MTPAQRFQTKEIARIQVYGRIDNLTAKVSDVSATGAKLEIVSGDYLPQRGDLLHFKIELSDIQKSYEINGEVKWNNGLGFGVCFIKKSELVQKMMQK